MSETLVAELRITPLARIVATGVSALSPEIMGLGPVEASRRALAHAGMTIDDIDLVEINEAFAAQVVPSYQDLGIDLDRLNVNGGAIAVGHPFGMTGARLQATMLNSLDWHDKSLGLITMCVGGGQGMALILERLASRGAPRSAEPGVSSIPCPHVRGPGDALAGRRPAGVLARVHRGQHTAARSTRPGLAERLRSCRSQSTRSSSACPKGTGRRMRMAELASSVSHSPQPRHAHDLADGAGRPRRARGLREDGRGSRP